MLRIVTVNWRNYEGRGAEYANILFDSCRRNLPEGMAGTFEVFTDDPAGLDPGITPRELPGNLIGWFNKLHLFKAGLFDVGDRIIFMDLDTVITGRLDEVAAYDGPFAILRDFYRPGGLQSSVMAWEADQYSGIEWTFRRGGYPMEAYPFGDQQFIEEWVEEYQGKIDRAFAPVILQDRFPGLFASYKVDDLGRHPPATASVVVFHGVPRPHQAGGWVEQVWRKGGMSRSELDSVMNTAHETVMDQVRSASERDLPWFDMAPEHDGHVCIVGGGPSLKDGLEELRWRQSIGQAVWALNGAAHYLFTQGIVADVVVIADAREENERFLTGLGAATGVYLASQCHPALFGRAEWTGRDTTVWHVNSPGVAELLAGERDRPVHLIGGGTTVGMNAIVLAFAKGFRKIHLYGLDSSIAEDHHAYAQPGNDGDRVIDALYNGQKFKTTAWMAQQVNDFQALVPILVADGCIITVAGDGLLPAVAKDMAENMPMTPAQVRAHEVLKRLNGAAEPHGVEVGVFVGEMSAALLRANPALRLDMVDSWEGDGQAYTGDSGDWHAELSAETQDDYCQRAQERVSFAGDRARIVRQRSQQAAESVQDGSLDFVFIDADHSYEGCMADLFAWARKVKPGGWICGHDYENHTMPKFGVTQAVNEFVAGSGLTLELGENFTWFLRFRTILESIHPERGALLN